MPYGSLKVANFGKNRIRFALLGFTILGYFTSSSLQFLLRHKLRRYLSYSNRLTQTIQPQVKMNIDPPVETNNPILSQLVYGCDDVLFGHIEKMEMLSSRKGDFGSFLDAGTGSHSLRWIASILHRTSDSGLLNNAKVKASFPVSMTNFTAGTN